MESAKNEDHRHEVPQAVQLREAKEYQRIKQQGLGKPIISMEFQGRRIVAVGDELYASPNWKTFIDFLDDYIKGVLGREWFKAEAQKEFKNKHPILQWYDIWLRAKSTDTTAKGEIISRPHIGVSQSFYGLANNLYRIKRNVGVQTELIRRLKLEDRSNFHGALLETCVASYFLGAGYDLEFENERDGDTTHCEFTATNQKTGRKFSVEAKALQFKAKGKPAVISKLRDALLKEANHERIVFIDLGKPSETTDDSKRWLTDAVERSNELETLPNLDGGDLPPAYVFFTNHSFWYDPEGTKSHFVATVEGFKIPFMKTGYKDTIHNLLMEREKHREILDLTKSIDEHREIPTTFDGENPEIAFNPDTENAPLIIGNKYLIPCNGKEEVGVLTHAIVHEDQKKVMGMYEVEGKGTRIVNCPISDKELAAYRRHPETYFGKVEPKQKSDNPLEFYDWLYDCYKNSTKENLLRLMKDWPNYEELVSLSQDELAKLYCEHGTEWATSTNRRAEDGKK